MSDPTSRRAYRRKLSGRVGANLREFRRDKSLRENVEGGVFGIVLGTIMGRVVTGEWLSAGSVFAGLVGACGGWALVYLRAFIGFKLSAPYELDEERKGELAALRKQLAERPTNHAARETISLSADFIFLDNEILYVPVRNLGPPIEVYSIACSLGGVEEPWELARTHAATLERLELRRLAIARREHDSRTYRWLFFSSADGRKEEFPTPWLRRDGHIVTMSITVVGEAKGFTAQALTTKLYLTGAQSSSDAFKAVS